MPTYEKRAKRGKNGAIVRYIGQNIKGLPEKFRLGYDLAEAERRIKLIEALWSHMEAFHGKVQNTTFRFPDRPARKGSYWDAEYLAAAKAIAKGQPPKLPQNGEYEGSLLYLKRIKLISDETGVEFEPANLDRYELGVSNAQAQMESGRGILSDALKVANATGKTVAQAMAAYEEVVRKRHTKLGGTLESWGKTRLDQVSSIRSYLSDERFGGRNFLKLDLAELTYERCDQIYGVIRHRPPTLRTGLLKRMTPSSAKNLIKEIGSFFDWLDGTDDFEWVEPRRFRSIVKTPDNLTAEEQYDRRQKKKLSVVRPEHLKTLFEYSLPIERVLLLLGLNCAFGAAEVGHLRTGFVHLDDSLIDGIRFKTGNEMRHRLWPETVDGLRWTLTRRQIQKARKPEHEEIVFLTERGRPMWHHSDKGNTSNGVSNVWDRLLQRVKKDHEEFPTYSFNKLRKTSATRILQIASAEVASMVLAHKTISDDELLENYAQIPWEKLYAAQEQYRREMGDIISAGGGNPWDEKRKTYIGLKKTKLIFELDSANTPASAIASELEIDVATVYRHLQTKHGKRKSGRKPKPR